MNGEVDKMESHPKTSKWSSACDYLGRHPKTALVGTVASVLGVALFFVANNDSPDLRYAVLPARTVVFRHGQVSRLNVMLDGKRVERDLTEAQVLVWNAGKKPIDEKDIRSKGVRIKTKNHEPIVEAIRKSNRDVVEVALETSRLEDGELLIKWNLLEINDGFLIQLVYEGDEKAEIEADCTLKSQPHITRNEYLPSEQKLVSIGAVASNKEANFGITVCILSLLSIPLARFLNKRTDGSTKQGTNADDTSAVKTVARTIWQWLTPGLLVFFIAWGLIKKWVALGTAVPFDF